MGENIVEEKGMQTRFLRISSFCLLDFETVKIFYIIIKQN